MPSAIAKVSLYPERFVKALADMGIDSLLIPEEHGGLEAGFVTVAAVWMELERMAHRLTCTVTNYQAVLTLFCVKVPKSKSIKSWRSRAPVSRCGTLLSPNRERDSDVGSLKTTYTRKNGKVYLNGSQLLYHQ